MAVSVATVGLLLSLSQAWLGVLANIWSLNQLVTSLYTGMSDHPIDDEILNPKTRFKGSFPVGTNGGSFYFETSSFREGIVTVGVRNYAPDPRDDPSYYESKDAIGLTSSPEPPPSWSIVRRLDPGARNAITAEPFARWYELASGWPFKSFYGAIRTDYQSAGTRYIHQWSIPYRKSVVGRGYSDPAIFPFKPLAGLIPNTLFYGVSGYLLYIMVTQRVRRTKRAIRIARERCPGCGYQIQDLEICPECGATSTMARPAPPR